MPKAMAALEFDLHLSDYTKSIALAGGLPVQLTRDADVVALIGHLDGLVLSGGADVEPWRYGADPEDELGLVEPDRDEWELALYRAARQRGIPVLGICRGFQLINVAEGGTLDQHVELDEGSGHPQWDVDGRLATHAVSCVASSIIGELLGADNPVNVNSLHHQTLERVAEGLLPTATAPDGVVEAVQSVDGLVLAVQWHPELLSAPDPTFCWLVDTALEVIASSGPPA